jgi:hypothetical protein
MRAGHLCQEGSCCTCCQKVASARSFMHGGLLDEHENRPDVRLANTSKRMRQRIRLTIGYFEPFAIATNRLGHFKGGNSVDALLRSKRADGIECTSRTRKCLQIARAPKVGSRLHARVLSLQRPEFDRRFKIWAIKDLWLWSFGSNATGMTQELLCSDTNPLEGP